MEDTLLKKLLASIVIFALVLALGFSVFAALTHQNKTSHHKTEEKIKRKRQKRKRKIIQQIKKLFKLNLRIHNKIM